MILEVSIYTGYFQTICRNYTPKVSTMNARCQIYSEISSAPSRLPNHDRYDDDTKNKQKTKEEDKTRTANVGNRQLIMKIFSQGSGCHICSWYMPYMCHKAQDKEDSPRRGTTNNTCSKHPLVIYFIKMQKCIGVVGWCILGQGQLDILKRKLNLQPMDRLA